MSELSYLSKKVVGKKEKEDRRQAKKKTLWYSLLSGYDVDISTITEMDRPEEKENR